MNITRSKKRKSIAILSLVATVFIAIVGFFYYLNTHHTDIGTSDTQTTSTQVTNKSEETPQEKQDYLDKSEKLNDNDDTVDNAQNPQNTTHVSKITLDASTSADKIILITNLSSITSGTCNLYISNGGKNISRSAEVIFAPEHSSCAGFSIAKSELGSGNWLIDLEVTSGSGSYTTSKEYTVT